MQHLKSYVCAAVVAAAISGCATPNKVTSDSYSALTIYPNNLVVLQGSERNTQNLWSINNETQVLAYKVVKPSSGIVFLNAVDIAKLEPTGEGKQKQIRVTLRSGESFGSAYAQLHICNKDKACQSMVGRDVPLPSYYYDVLFGKKNHGFDDYPSITGGMFNLDVNSTRTIKIEAGDAAVKFRTETLPQARTRMKERWDADMVVTKQKIKTEEERVAVAEAAAVARKRVDCATTGFSLASPMDPWREQSSVACDGGTWRSTVGGMRNKGWGVASINSEVVPGDGINPTHRKHYFIFTR